MAVPVRRPRSSCSCVKSTGRECATVNCVLTGGPGRGCRFEAIIQSRSGCQALESRGPARVLAPSSLQLLADSTGGAGHIKHSHISIAETSRSGPSGALRTAAFAAQRQCADHQRVAVVTQVALLRAIETAPCHNAQGAAARAEKVHGQEAKWCGDVVYCCLYMRAWHDRFALGRLPSTCHFPRASVRSHAQSEPPGHGRAARL